MSTKIALDGVGGQGVRLIAGVMGALLARMGKEVTVLFDYDSSVRGSMSDAFLIFDDRPIENPVVEEAVTVYRLPLPKMPLELLSLFEWGELSKYMTPEELEDLPGAEKKADLPSDKPEGA